ncbi:ammonium transporter [Gimesia maris]|uniref:histidine kinase n=1 Tax=Gimesia maris TaxID=122 RepID=A0ABX5YW80_9PLAN|nr:ammonium transporter [Gimesia maris]EDL60673.1 ammonium/methylammonium permease [Gimesia maris DSM 8797]QEG19817.1 Autoinducer 2 sensor kinase/phosphatase LuxQ [Gimesia maris]QGQ27365.1 ammonium transporter [Gimesia maris]
MELHQQIDILWILVCSLFVLFMQAGFCCLESGLSRSKNSIHVAIKNVVDVSIVGILYWIFGFGLMFGTTTGGLIGTTHFPFTNSGSDIFLSAFFLFQLMLCVTAATIASGASAERMRFTAYLILSIVLGGIIYPVFGHWAWTSHFTGKAPGWLESLGFRDFSGSTVVHSLGAWAALASIMIIGPRIGKFDKQSGSKKLKGHNLTLATTGVFILWMGWFGFNGGSEFGFTSHVPQIFINTFLASACGAITMLVWQFYQKKQIEIENILNGLLAGLVASSASCDAVSPAAAVVIGIIAAIVMEAGVWVLERFQLDDTIGVIPVHGFAGVWGTLAVALFIPAELLSHSRWEQFLIQLLGCGVCFIWCFSFCWVTLRIISHFVRLRATKDEEKLGLNMAEHGATSEMYDLLNLMELHIQGDTELGDDMDEYSDVSLIAKQYNRVSQVRDLALNELKDRTENLELTRRELEEKAERLKQANTDAEAASRAKSEFLANMSHEIRTPMTAVLGYTDLLIEESWGRPGSIQLLDVIKRNGHYLLELINDILDLSKIESGNLTIETIQFSLLEKMKEIQSLMKVRAELRGLHFKLSFEGTLPVEIQSDPTRLKQILINLIGNAIKFSPDGGKVSVETSFLNSSADNPLLEFKISDTGIGMTAEQIAMLYQPFVQADSSTTRKFGGTGLGLAISKRLAEMLGGDLTCESVPGEGTVFTLTIGIGNPETLKFHENPQDKFRQIPVIQQDPELPAGDSETMNLGPCTVLLAEDGVDNQRLISMLLKKEKAHVVLAENGDIAVRRALNAEQQGKPFDVILMDMSMPVLDGYGATRKLRELGIETPIIALTAHAMTGDRQKCIDAGCSDYATKPVNREKLRNIILKYRSRAQAEPVT